MSYSGANVITMARRLLVDSSDEAHLEADMLAYLNEGQKRFASESHCCQSVVSISVTAQTITYAALVSAIGASAEQVLSVLKVTPKVGTNLTPLPFAPMSEMKALLASTVTTPTRYNVFAESIYFDTHPDTTLSFTAIVACSFVPIDLAATSNDILTPDEWVQALVKYVEFCCRIAERDAGGANGAYDEFEAIKQSATAIIRQRSLGGMG